MSFKSKTCYYLTEYKNSLLNYFKFADLEIIPVQSMNVTYNQLYKCFQLSSKLKSKQKEYDIYNFSINPDNKLNSPYLLNPDDILFLLYLKNQIIGYELIKISNDENKYGLLLEFFIDDKFRSKGYGTFLLHKTEQLLKKKYRIDVIYLNCLNEDPNRLFYLKNDYLPAMTTYVKKI